MLMMAGCCANIASCYLTLSGGFSNDRTLTALLLHTKAFVFNKNKKMFAVKLTCCIEKLVKLLVNEASNFDLADRLTASSLT